MAPDDSTEIEGIEQGAENPASTGALDQDAWLQELVGRINTLGEIAIRKEPEVSIGIGLTLCVSGVVVSGIAISILEYIREYAKQSKTLYGSISDRLGETIHQYVTEMGEKTLTLSSPTALPRFIHLKNVRFGSPRTDGGPDWPLWRGRISEVSGFALGAWEVANPSNGGTEK